MNFKNIQPGQPSRQEKTLPVFSANHRCDHISMSNKLRSTTWRIMFTLDVCDLTLISGCVGGGGGETGEKVAKPVTRVPHCVSTPFDIFRKTSGQSPAVFVPTKADILRRNVIFS